MTFSQHSQPEKRLNGALLLLTPEQIDILHLEDKHVTIDYQKSIISLTQAKDNLPESELLYYLFYDSRSALLNEMSSSNPKIFIYLHKIKNNNDMITFIIMSLNNI